MPGVEYDYYEVLGIPRNASDADIKKAYRQASLNSHPDRGGNTALFGIINNAYQTLIDPDKRRRYNDCLDNNTTFVQDEPPPPPPRSSSSNTNSTKQTNNVRIGEDNNTNIEEDDSLYYYRRSGFLGYIDSWKAHRPPRRPFGEVIWPLRVNKLLVVPIGGGVGIFIAWMQLVVVKSLVIKKFVFSKHFLDSVTPILDIKWIILGALFGALFGPMVYGLWRYHIYLPQKNNNFKLIVYTLILAFVLCTFYELSLALVAFGLLLGIGYVVVLLVLGDDS